MRTVKEIKEAVARLTNAERSELREWFVEFDAAAWDLQFEADVHAGRLGALADEALAELHAGRCNDR